MTACCPICVLFVVLLRNVGYNPGVHVLHNTACCPSASVRVCALLLPVQVESLAQLGVQLLLFHLGRELTFSKLKAVWSVALVGGALQIVALSALGGVVAAVLESPVTQVGCWVTHQKMSIPTLLCTTVVLVPCAALVPLVPVCIQRSSKLCCVLRLLAAKPAHAAAGQHAWTFLTDWSPHMLGTAL